MLEVVNSCCVYIGWLDWTVTKYYNIKLCLTIISYIQVTRSHYLRPALSRLSQSNNTFDIVELRLEPELEKFPDSLICIPL